MTLEEPSKDVHDQELEVITTKEDVDADLEEKDLELRDQARRLEEVYTISIRSSSSVNMGISLFS